MNAFAGTNRRLHNLLIGYLYLYNAQQSRSSALLWATKHGQGGTAEKSLGQGANPQVVGRNGSTPLCLAKIFGHYSVLKVLLATGAVDLGSRDNNGRTPLSWAARGGHDVIVKQLLATGAVNPDSRSDNGRTPLSWGAGAGHHTIVKHLLATGAVDPHSRSDYGRTPLSWAVWCGHGGVVSSILEQRASTYNPEKPDIFRYCYGKPHSADIRQR